MRNLILMCLLVLSPAFAVLFLTGCVPPPEPETSTQKETRLEQMADDRFPTEAKFVKELGNGWFTFKLEIEGEVRTFLWRSAEDLVGDGQSRSEALTELQPTENGKIQKGFQGAWH